MREKIRAVMRGAEPRLFWRHTLLALAHRLDERRKKPEPRKKTTNSAVNLSPPVLGGDYRRPPHFTTLTRAGPRCTVRWYSTAGSPKTMA